MYYVAIGGAVKTNRTDYIMNLINTIGCRRFTCFITGRGNTAAFLLYATGLLQLTQNRYGYTTALKQQTKHHLTSVMLIAIRQHN